MPDLPQPDTTSRDYDAMLPYWEKVEAILGGAAAMREAGQTYLPQFPQESADDYEHRRATAPFTNIFRDIVENLASKPFAKKCQLADGSASGSLKELAEDIDGRGNNLHVFAGQTFFNGIAKAIDWIMVDHTKVPTGATRETEKKIGARPYWLRIPAEQMIAVYSDMVDGREEFIHARILEPTIERDGYCEVEILRVRVLTRDPIVDIDPITGRDVVIGYQPARFELWERKLEEKTASGRQRSKPKVSWEMVDAGLISIGIIPLVPFLTGRRKGDTWQVLPPMADAADVQIEHYQQETGLKSAKERTAFVMLTGNGVSPARDEHGNAEKIPVGPFSVLYAPMDEKGNHGEWDTLNPGAEELKFLAADLEATERRLRELGRQPLTAQTGNLTVVTTAFAAQKGNSAVQAWALNLKDALERACELTRMWIKETSATAEVQVYTDFDVTLQEGTSMERLIKMAEKGKLSDETLRAEAKRRGELSADFDEEEEVKRLREQGPDPSEEDDEAANTPPLKKAA